MVIVIDVFCKITDSFSHLSVQASQFFCCMSVYEHLISVSAVFSRRSTEPSKNFVCRLGQRLLSMCIFGNGRASLPNILIFWFAMALVSSDLFDKSKLYERWSDLAPFLNCHLSVLFLQSCQSAELFVTSEDNFPFCFAWHSNYRCFCSLWESELSLKIFQAVSFPISVVSLHAMKFPSAVRGRVNSFSLQTALLLQNLR